MSTGHLRPAYGQGMGRGKAPVTATQGLQSRHSDESPSEVKRLRVKAHQLQRGDKLIPTAREVLSLHQAGVDIPSDKVEVIFTNRQVKRFGKHTELTIERPSA